LTLKLRVGRKGYIILPKAIQEAVGIREGDEVIVEVKDAIIIRPARRANIQELRKALREHASKLARIKGRREPELGELAKVSLEEKFES